LAPLQAVKYKKIYDLDNQVPNLNADFVWFDVFSMLIRAKDNMILNVYNFFREHKPDLLSSIHTEFQKEYKKREESNETSILQTWLKHNKTYEYTSFKSHQTQLLWMQNKALFMNAWNELMVAFPETLFDKDQYEKTGINLGVYLDKTYEDKGFYHSIQLAKKAIDCADKMFGLIKDFCEDNSYLKQKGFCEAGNTFALVAPMKAAILKRESRSSPVSEYLKGAAPDNWTTVLLYLVSAQQTEFLRIVKEYTHYDGYKYFDVKRFGVIFAAISSFNDPNCPENISSIVNCIMNLY
jgi:hypothetical protein